MLRGNRHVVAALAGLKKHPILGIFGALPPSLALYYAIIAIVGPHYTQVCSKAEQGQPDQCAYWDAVSSVIVRTGIWADQHNGLIAAFAGVTVAIFTAVLWRSTEKLWVAGEKASANSADATEVMREANRIAAASNRPWLNVVAEVTPSQVIDWVTIEGMEVCIIPISFSVQHFGSAPAINVETIGDIVDGADAVEAAVERAKKRATAAVRKFLPTTIFPGDKPEPLEVAVNFHPKSDGTGKNVVVPYLVACATYTNATTGARHMSIRVYRFTKISTRINKANCPFPASHLEMTVSRHIAPFYT